MQHIDFRAMGCDMLAVLDDDRASAMAALSQVPRWFAAWEQQLSRFRADSELSMLNRTGYSSSASPALWDVIQLALAQARYSGSLVTPTLLDALEATGYRYSFDMMQARTAVARSSSMLHSACEQQTSPANGTIAAPPRAAQYSSNCRYAWQAIRCDPATRSIQLPAGVRLDLGGSAKGWAAEKAVRRLAEYGPALVDAGGDIAVSGPRADGMPWSIGVAYPCAPDEQIELLMLQHGGVATSGRDYRRWQRNGVWQHHLIDPRTMQPAITDVLSATVIGPSAPHCEVAAKVVLLLGSCEGFQWLEAQPTLAGLATLEDGTVLRSSRLQAYRWEDGSDEGATL